MTKLIFIMNDSEAFLYDEVTRISKEWGFTVSNVKYTERWNPALARGSVSLFGDVSMIHLDLKDKSDLKAFADLVKDKKQAQMFEGNWFGPALIITSTHAQGTKKIEDLIKKSGGTVVKKEKPEVMRKKLLGRMKLNRETKAFVESYVGQDYDMLISVSNELAKMSAEDQMALTPDELIIRLPAKPGAVPPWEFINPMLEGNAKAAIDLFDRSMGSSHILVAMLLARKKLQLLYRLKVLQGLGITNSKDQAKHLNERNGPNIWITAKTAQRISIQTAESLAKLSREVEAQLKGESSVDPEVLFRNYISTVCLSIKYDRKLF